MFRVFEKINMGEVYIIAEMSANHAGKLDNALEIVRKAAEAGADCVKICLHGISRICTEIFYVL